MNTIYTVGYGGGLKRGHLLRVAQRLELTVLDTRYSPKSRNAAWTKTNLERALGNHYVHIPALGNLNYRAGGSIQIADPESGLEQAATCLERGSIVLLCVCSNITLCHRRLVAEMLSQRTGAPVVHWSPQEVADLAADDQPAQLQMALF